MYTITATVLHKYNITYYYDQKMINAARCNGTTFGTAVLVENSAYIAEHNPAVCRTYVFTAPFTEVPMACILCFVQEITSLFMLFGTSTRFYLVFCCLQSVAVVLPLTAIICRKLPSIILLCWRYTMCTRFFLLDAGGLQNLRPTGVARKHTYMGPGI